MDIDSWERRELHKIQKGEAGQETLQKNDWVLSPFPSFVLFGGLYIDSVPCTAANSNKQECGLFLAVKKHRSWKASGELQDGDCEQLEGSVSGLLHLWSFIVVVICLYIVPVCHLSSVLLISTLLTSFLLNCSNRSDAKIREGRSIYVWSYKTDRKRRQWPAGVKDADAEVRPGRNLKPWKRQKIQ